MIFLEQMIGNLIPVVIMKLRAIPTDQKRVVAEWLGNLCSAYVKGDRIEFDYYLEDFTMPTEWKTQLAKALWDEK